jgi:copper chaperone CopZ
MKRIIIAVICLLTYFNSAAQITRVELQASGLTCSMCSKSIHKSLSSLSYIKNIEVDLNQNLFVVTFKDSALVNLDDLKQKVTVAGYTVAKMWVNLQVNETNIKNDTHIELHHTTYHFMNVKDQIINGAIKVQVLDKGFVSNKEYKKNTKLTTMTCYKTGYMESCCNINKKEKTRIYHITI